MAQLLKEPVGTERSYEINESTGESDSDHVEGEVTLTRTNRGILVTGRLTADIQGSCSRCLGSTCASAVFTIEDEYLPVIDVNSGAHVEVEPDSFTIDHNHVLDLDEAIREYTIIATPTKLLCKADCPGMCPVCGQEFAKGDCEHRNKPSDHRWDKLTEARKKESMI